MMNSSPTYDSNVPKNYYASFGEKEWTRLVRDCAGELLYHVHMDVFRCYVHQEASVLELGAGAGIFSKELVRLARQVVVSDISEEQLAINKLKMTELGLANRIQDFLMLDITDLKSLHDEQYDIVTCVGGALNYTFDREQAAIHEILRVTKPGGIVIVGVVALFNSIMRYLSAIAEEKQQFGIHATKWLIERGIQDAEHYPVENKNFLHMMQSRDLDALFENEHIQSLEKRAAGIFALAGEEALNQAKADQELWELLLNKEIEFSKDPTYLNCGANLIYVVKKL
ncbi:MAG TPA: class I SAM-dependent methyltransferase [Anaerolineales bacterium]|nr:class I SAM-dependent methyltransferase [Anaerolineales bacterium]HLO29712.1 class I SAM-dependent methyltransferase [Anaerolineales bacterium]